MNRLRRAAEGFRRNAALRAGAAFALHFAYALFNGWLGFWNQSPWFAALCVYYGLLAGARFLAVFYGGWKRERPGKGAVAAKWTGLLLAALSFALALVIWTTLSQDIAAKRGEIVMITIATYTFSKIGAAAVQAVKGRKNRDWLPLLLRRIRWAETAASVFTLQRSMVDSFGAMALEKRRILDASTGAACCLLILALGIETMRKAGAMKAEQ